MDSNEQIWTPTNEQIWTPTNRMTDRGRPETRVPDRSSLLPLVIPAQAGIHVDPRAFAALYRRWIPASAGMTKRKNAKRCPTPRALVAACRPKHTWRPEGCKRCTDDCSVLDTPGHRRYGASTLLRRARFPRASVESSPMSAW